MNHRPLRICMVSNLYPPIPTGSATQCAGLAKALADHDCQVIVITTKSDRSSPAYETTNGVHVYRLPAIRLPRLGIALNFPWLFLTMLPGNMKRIDTILARHEPDIIHLHNHMFDMAFLAVKAARKSQKPLVITIHTMVRHSTKFYDFLLVLFDKFILRKIILNNSALLIVPERTIFDYVESYFKVKKPILIPYGIDQLPSPVPEKIKALRKKYKLTQGPIILSIGHLHSIRNRKELIEILPELVKKFPDIQVLIVGDVGTRSVEKLGNQLGVSEHIVFTGTIPKSELADHMALGEVEAHWFDKSHPQQVPGIAAQEAMAAGKVVFSVAKENVYGEGVLRDWSNIMLIDPENPKDLITRIVAVLNDGPKRREIGEQARQTIRSNFSWEIVSEQTIRVYRAVLSNASVAGFH